MIISKKKFEEEIRKRVEEALCKCEENHWRGEQERNRERFIADIENRLIAVEKANGIDHPSHHRGDHTTPTRW